MRPRSLVRAVAALLPLSAPLAAAADCTSSCNDDYYACTNTASIGDCSHYRSMCYQSCTLNGPSELYGAIAYSPSANKFGTSARYPTEAEAEARSIVECRKRGGSDDCKPMWFVVPNCGALATGPGRWGYDWGESREAADDNALAKCGKGGTIVCTVDVTVCATDQLE